MNTFEELLGHVIALDFDTHESMIEAALLWQLEEYQFDNGSFKGSINAVHTLNIQIASTFRSNGIFLKGKTHKNAYLFASVESEGKKTHNGLSILEDELVVLTEKDQLDYIVSSAVNDILIAIDKDFFDAAFKNYFNTPFQYDKCNKRIQLKKNAGSGFRTSAKELLFNLVEQNVKLQNDPDFHKKAEQDALEIIFQNMDLFGQRKKRLEGEINADKIRKQLEANYKNDICINELCSSEKVSERTLRSSFKNLFGLSPKQYHLHYRLGKIHHVFLQNDYSLGKVENIAYAHGFTHMGHFTHSYKLMFGDTPAHILKKTSPGPAKTIQS